MPNCAYCRIHACDRKAAQQMPPNCPSHDITDQTLMEYLTERNRDFGREASIVSMSPDGKLPRIMEIIDLAHRCRFQKLGVAFCIGFVKEAEILASILKRHNFSVESVVCKVGGIDKAHQGIENGGNAMCNPIAQAQLLNDCHTDFNIALGLCVGHDSLFFRYSQAPATVLAVKDKVLAHNPLGALYTADGYYRDLLYPDSP